MSDIESFLDNASTISLTKLDAAGGNIEDLGEPYRTVVTIYAAQGVIDNGGLFYFFESDWPNNPPYSLFADAYRRIGRKEAGDAIDYAAWTFGIPFPERNKDFRNKFMEKQFGTDDSEGQSCIEWNDCICGDEEVWTDLAKWLRKNYPNSFDE
ncbi:MAG: hypothetical protein R3C56_32770 [Pirellulaceae bacterium]